MSIKIYDGFRFTTSDLLEVHRLLQELREEMAPLADEKIAQWFAWEATSRLDDFTLGLIDPEKVKGRTPLSLALEMYTDLMLEVRKGRRVPEIDFGFSVSVLPANGKVLGMAFTEQAEWKVLLFEKPYVKPYGYWDNTDPDEECTEEEWEEREKDWTEALRLDGRGLPPAMAGFSVDLVLTERLFPDTDDVLAHLPEFGRRLHRVALNAVVGEKSMELQGDDEKDGSRAVWKALRWVRTEEGQEKLEGKKKELEPRLVRELTFEHMTEKLETQKAA